MRALSSILKKLLERGYIDYKLTNNTIQDISLLRFGTLLSRNLISEWYKKDSSKNVISISSIGTIDLQAHKVSPTIYLDNILQKEFSNIKKLTKNTDHFAVKQALPFINKTELFSEEFNINLHKGTLLTCDYLFANATVAREYFHKIQRERKIWWMYLSFSPGRFTLCDFKSINQSPSVSIKSKFDFGTIQFEDISMIQLKPLSLEKFCAFSLRDSQIRKKLSPVAIHTEFCLEAAILGLLIDATEGPDSEKISLNRKIAPYQCNIFYISKDTTEIATLKNLAKHINKIVANSGITIYKMEHAEQNQLDDIFNQMDGIGIPYAIILDAQTLLNGVMNLRNRDTTLSEFIHITDVPNYLKQIFQN